MDLGASQTREQRASQPVNKATEVAASVDEAMKQVNGAVNPEKINSFELYRTSIQDVEIITFDELYQRACFIVEDR
ncbi:hypothetical protein [Streptomyces sp. bgisy126]|uniref:hypothetical protein n=1 Tax=unclassified Streptomyces TaxID=2593676 RepID=UPI003EBAB8AA